MEKYYKILEIPINSNENDIKKAYKKLAMKYHPDRNLDNKDEASKKFKEVSDAYQILSSNNNNHFNNMEIPNFNNLRTPISIFQELFTGLHDNNFRTSNIEINKVSKPFVQTIVIQNGNGISIKRVTKSNF